MRPAEVAEFLTDLPDGAVESDGAFLVWPGRPALEAISELLVGLGCDVDAIESADSKGWELDFKYRGRRLWLRVSVIERVVACFDDPSFWPKVIGRTHPLYLELLSRLGEALDRDPRFQDVRWYAANAFEPHISEPEPAA